MWSKPSGIAKSVIVAGILMVASGASAQSLDGAAIDGIVGTKGQFIEAEQVYKVSFPRRDIPVTVDGTRLPPFMGFTSWAAFTPAKHAEAMVMGDIVLFEDEVNPAMSTALDNGLAVTALHNHFFFERPRTFFMHIGGQGDAADLARGVRKVLDQISAIRRAHPVPRDTFGNAALPEKSNVTPGPLAEVFGMTPSASDGMVKFVIGREGMMHGVKVGKEMGLNTWAAFFGTDDHAVVDGDFITVSGELQPVLKSLRRDGINIVAIHQHMEGEEPAFIFLHYWGIGPAKDLAAKIKRALAAQEAAR